MSMSPTEPVGYRKAKYPSTFAIFPMTNAYFTQYRRDLSVLVAETRLR